MMDSFSPAHLRQGYWASFRAFILSAATARGTLIAVGLYLISLAALTLADQPLERAAPGMTKPDLTFGYTYADIIAIFTAYGTAGRQAYLLNLLVDSVMPVMFAGAAVLVVARAAPRWFGWFAFAPVVFLLLDLVENAALAVMLAQFPEISPALVSFTRPITMIKLSAFMIAMPTLIIGALILAVTGLSQWRKARISVP
jgi:hypothetical protein